MNSIGNFFNLILLQPLFNILILLYEYLPGHDFGVAVIALTVLIRLVFYPLMVSSIKSQKIMTELQPKLKEIQEKYKDNKQEQSKAMMELYKKEKFNPFSGCLPLLVQFPILIALYQIFLKGFKQEQMTNLYSFVSNPGAINMTFLGILNLEQPSAVLAVLAGIAQFVQTKMTFPKDSPSKDKASSMVQNFSKQMLYIFPVFTVLILLKLPSVVGLYWITTTVFSIIQQYLVLKPRSENLTAVSK